MNYNNQKDTNNQDNNKKGNDKKDNKRKEWDFDKKINLYYLIYSIVVLLSIIALFIYLATQAFAKDLGKYGNTYVISEPDMLEDINNKLARHEGSGRLEEFNKNYRQEVKRQIKQPNRVSGITNATEDKTRKFDPTTELEEDIVVPINTTTSIADNKEAKQPEEIEYTILHKAGTKINPLDYMAFNEPLVFIDGEIEAQREFANKQHDNNPLSKIILINGKTGIQTEGDKEYYYYFDQWGAYSSRFNISVVPSVVYQEKDEKVLTIDEVRVE